MDSRHHQSIKRGRNLRPFVTTSTDENRMAMCYAGRSMDDYIAKLYNQADGDQRTNRTFQQAVDDIRVNNQLRQSVPNALDRVNVIDDLTADDIRAFGSRVQNSFIASTHICELAQRLDANKDEIGRAHV